MPQCNRITSTAATVGAAHLRSLFTALETAGREKNASTAAGIIARLKREFTRFRKAAFAGK